MAFVVPTFIVPFVLWRSWVPSVSTYANPFAKNDLCNLTPGKRVYHSSGPNVGPINGQTLYVFQMEMLLPSLYDIQTNDDVASEDVVEIPKGSKRLYQVLYVDDVARGFANQHRFALLQRFAVAAVFSDITIPVPRPLP